ESECAALAAKAVTRVQLQAIEAALGDMERELAEGMQPLPGDRLFHLRIVEATGNGALVHVVRTLWDERAGPLYQQLEQHYDSPDLWQAAMAEHRVVLESLAAHDARGARAAMRRHLDQAYKRFSAGWDMLH
ncbi:MAG: FadR family transcriptional regulator, partial [Betaproteobacteria bacterium]|nr:FadR family transcriptional regulator [Betaproteobacteria bacterium]